MSEVENAAHDVAAVIADKAQEVVAEQREAETQADKVQTAIVEAAIHTAQQERIGNIESDLAAHKSTCAERDMQWREQVSSLTTRLESLEARQATEPPQTIVVATEPPTPINSEAPLTRQENADHTTSEAPADLPPPQEPRNEQRRKRRFLL